MITRSRIAGNPKLLKKLIQEFVSSSDYKEMVESDNYYSTNNTVIADRKKMMMLYDEQEVIVNGQPSVETVPYLKPDLSKSNFKTIHSYHSELVNQCKNYLCGRPVGIVWKDNITVSDELKEEIDEILYRFNNWKVFNQENVKNAQKYKRSWFRLVIDNYGKLKFIIVNPKEVISFEDDFGELTCIIRIYEREEYNDKAEKVTLKYAEVYDNMFKDVYISSGNKDYVLHEESVPLLYKQITYDGDFSSTRVIDAWSKIPWIQWKFNDDDMTSLKPIKTFIDILDINLSDLANNIDDIQDAVWILENYQGQSLQEFMDDLKIKKAINVGEGGKVDNKTVEIPYEAREKLYEICEKNIYRFGRGIDFSRRNDLGNSTGVALKWAYGPLDEKADELENYGEEALNRLFSLMLEYINKYITPVPEYITSNSLEFIFDRTMITNEKEKVEMLLGSTGMISAKTILENHPFVPDVDIELNRLSNDVSGDYVPEIKEIGETDEIDNEAGRNKRQFKTY